MESIRHLVVVRHARAESMAEKDKDRVLTDDGRSDARALGSWLADQGIVADAAYVSSAARTRETWQLVSEAAGWDVEPRVDGLLYSTDEDGVVEIVRETPDSARTAVVIGHNPTIAMLVQLLDDGEANGFGDLSGFPTAAAAILEVSGDWADLAPMSCRLRGFHVARD